MRNLKDELYIKMQEYHNDILELINSVYTQNILEGVLSDSYCRVAALNATKKIIKVDDQAEMFYNEALNDFLSSHVMILLGSSRVSLTALRAFIENYLFYFYFIDHKVELSLWKNGNHKIKFSELFEYLRMHPKVTLSKQQSAIERLYKEYTTLSMAVHGSSEKFMMTKQDNFPHVFQSNNIVISQWNTRAKNVFQCIMRIILSFYKEFFVTAAHKHERKIISIALGNKVASKISQEIGITL